MIVYTTQSWILRPSMISENVMKKSLLFSCNYAILIGIVSILYEQAYLPYTIHSPNLKELLNIFSFFFFMGLGFRLNTAYANWSNGVDLVIRIMHCSMNIINTMYIHLSVNEKKYNENNIILNQYKHYVLEYISSLFHIPRNEITRRRSTMDTYKIDSIHYITHSDIPMYDEEQSIEQQLPFQRTYLRMEALMKRTILQNTSSQYFSESHGQILIQLLDQLFAYRITLYRIQNIPPVCLYIQLFDFHLYMYLLLYGVSIIPQSGYYACIWMFLWGFIISLALNVAKEIDSPFGTDKNDIQMDIILQQVRKDIELITFLLK